jgi:hypothetical protein
MKTNLNALLVLVLLLALGVSPIKANFLSNNWLIEFTTPPDTIKPSISLLGVDTAITPLKADYNDAPIALIDDVDSDSAMRPYLNMSSTLPIGANGKYFCDQSGYFKMTYFVKDLAGNLSDTAIRVVYCDGSTSILKQVSASDKIGLGLDVENKTIHLTVLELPNQKVELQLLDLYGREIALLAFQNQQNDFVIEYNHLPAGVYLLAINIGRTVFVKKVFLN